MSKLLNTQLFRIAVHFSIACNDTSKPSTFSIIRIIMSSSAPDTAASPRRQSALCFQHKLLHGRSDSLAGLLRGRPGWVAAIRHTHSTDQPPGAAKGLDYDRNNLKKPSWFFPIFDWPRAISSHHTSQLPWLHTRCPKNSNVAVCGSWTFCSCPFLPCRDTLAYAEEDQADCLQKLTGLLQQPLYRSYGLQFYDKAVL